MLSIERERELKKAYAAACFDEHNNANGIASSDVCVSNVFNDVRTQEDSSRLDYQ